MSEHLDELEEARGALDALALDHARMKQERDDALRELARERKHVETLTALLRSFRALMDHVDANLKASEGGR